MRCDPPVSLFPSPGSSAAGRFPARIFEGPAEPGPPPSPQLPHPPAEPLFLLNCPLAGFQFHDGTKVWSRLRVGDRLDLKREPGNPHDPKAVAVYWKGARLGYVPRFSNGRASNLMDQGKSVHAVLAAMREGAPPWGRLDLTLWYEP